MSAADTNSVQRIRVIDSHTAGEPTRVVIEGGPELGDGSLYERRELFREKFDHYRSAIVNEPRGADVLVGALLCKPVNPQCAAGVIFFNNVGYLNMCGHGAIGLIATLAWLGRIEPGSHLIETPIGEIATRLRADGRVSVRNVPCYRYQKGVEVDVPDYGKVVGDVAWGGNWFFLVSEHQEALDHRNVNRLTDVALRIRAALRAQGITGNTSAEIDHIELFAPAQSAGADSRNFVLCPGGAYDRSPCGTGTSAKLACLAADGKLKPGQKWVQESIIGSRFEASYMGRPDMIFPKITGAAYVMAETTLILQNDDPLRTGIRG